MPVKRLPLLLLFFLSLLNCGLVVGDCPNDCSGNGSCLEAQCGCYTLYHGDDCSVSWITDERWMLFFWGYVALQLLLHGSLLIFGAYRLIDVLLAAHRYHKPKFSVVTQGLFILIIAEFLRVVYYSVDPHFVRRFTEPYLNPILYNAPLLLWIIASFLVILYWIELQKISGIQQLQSVSKTKKLLIVFMIVTALIILPLGLYQGLDDSMLSDILFHGAVAAALIFLCILSFIYGRRLFNVMKSMWMASKEDHLYIFLRKLTWILLSANILGLLALATMALFVVFSSNEWAWIVLHVVLSFEESGIVLSVMMFLGRTKPKAATSAENTLSTYQTKGRQDTF